MTHLGEVEGLKRLDPGEDIVKTACLLISVQKKN